MDAAQDRQRVVVTGAFGALGAAVVAAARQAGWRVAALDRADDRGPLAGGAGTGEAGPASDPGVLRIGGVDLGDEQAARAAFDRAAAHFGGLDALVHLAGGFRWETVEGGSLDSWDALYATNLRSAVSAARTALPHLRRGGAGGRIVFVGAAAAARATAGMGAYTASKAGVARLTEALADELKDAGITVNAVLPSVLDTPANRVAMPDADPARWVAPPQLADVILFLLSDRAQAVTGALLPVVGRV
jgi:NAD(P)-dependent dehydrogenase (short-subunit alcohol dehydrogenase family)